MAMLIVDEGGADERRIALEPGVVTVGTEADCDIRFPEDETLVSARHASLQPETTRWYVRDEGSRYGTLLNHRRVKEHGLADGDLIELGVGGPRLRFVATDPSAGPAEGGPSTEARPKFGAEGRDTG